MVIFNSYVSLPEGTKHILGCTQFDPIWSEFRMAPAGLTFSICQSE